MKVLSSTKIIMILRIKVTTHAYNVSGTMLRTLFFVSFSLCNDLIRQFFSPFQFYWECKSLTMLTQLRSGRMSIWIWPNLILNPMWSNNLLCCLLGIYLNSSFVMGIGILSEQENFSSTLRFFGRTNDQMNIKKINKRKKSNLTLSQAVRWLRLICHSDLRKE